MNDQTYLLIFRLVHISCGTFWAGTLIYLAVFINPAVKAAGPEGGKFMQHLSRTNKMPLVMMLVGGLTVISGILLIWRLSDGFQNEWMGTPHGIVVSIGGTIAIIGYLVGITVNRPTITRIASMGKTIGAQGGPASPDQLQQLEKLRIRLFTATNVVATLLAITVIAMSIVRYI